MRSLSELPSLSYLPFSTHPRLSLLALVFILGVVPITLGFFKYDEAAHLEKAKHQLEHHQAKVCKPAPKPAPKPRKESFSVTVVHQVE